ncbi:MAG: PAS domain S-box protein, partial [Dehalococcoidales bacterium]|nr:PAS domain S-box protein [Dehalococcoidales bacterium]
MKNKPALLKGYNTLFDALPAPAMLIDAGGMVLDINPKFIQVFGGTKEVLIGKNFLEYVTLNAAEDSTYKKSFKIEALQNIATSFETKLSNAAGEDVWVVASFNFFTQDKNTYCIAVFHDFTKQKLAEDNVKASEARYRNIIENASELIQMTDASGKIIFTNKIWKEKLGYTDAEISDLLIFDITRADEKANLLEMLKQVRRGSTVRNFATVLVTKNGTEVFLEGSVNPRIENGKRVGVRSIYRDVTDKTKAEELYTKLVNNSPVGIYIVQDGIFHFVNPQFQSITGYTEEELLGLSPLSLVHPDDRAKVRDNAVQMVKGNKPRQMEFRIITKDGKEKWAIENILSIVHDGKKASLGNFLDITERVKMETALRKALAVSEASMAEVSALLEASQTVLTQPQFKDAAGAIFGIFKRLTGAAGGYVALAMEKENRYQLVYLDSAGLECHLDTGVPMLIRGLSAESYKKGVSLYNNDFSHSEWVSFLPERHFHIENIMFTPLL